MAKHRAPVDDLQWWEERGSGVDRKAVDLRWPAPRKGPADGLARVPTGSGVVGVARVPATSRLTPPDRDLRDQGPRPERATRRAVDAGQPAPDARQPAPDAQPAPGARQPASGTRQSASGARGRHQQSTEPEC